MTPQQAVVNKMAVLTYELPEDVKSVRVDGTGFVGNPARAPEPPTRVSPLGTSFTFAK